MTNWMMALAGVCYIIAGAGEIRSDVLIGAAFAAWGTGNVFFAASTLFK